MQEARAKWRRIGKLALLAIAAMGWSISHAAADDAYPTKPITLIVPYSPGGGTDTLVRLLEPHLTKRLGQPLLIETRPGAGGMIGTQAVVNSAADGYTLLIHSGAITTEVGLKSDLPYDVRTDLIAISQLTSEPNVVLVSNDFPAKTVAELVEYAKQNPGKLRFGSSGIGSSTQFSAELFKMMAGVDIVHVPYKGGPPSYLGLGGNDIQLLFDPISSSRRVVDAGQGRAIAIAARTQSPFWPELPTVGESVPGYETSLWYGLFAPAGTPQNAIDRIQQVFSETMNDPDMRKQLEGRGMRIITSKPAEFSAVIDKEIEVWSDLVKSAGIKTP